MPSSRRRPVGPSLTTVQALAIASQFGVTLAVAVGLGLFVGQWLDGRFQTSFIFTLIGVLLGLASAISGTVRLYRAALRQGEPGGPRTRTSAEDLAEDQTER